MMPVPTQLSNCIIPHSPEIDESGLEGKVRCPCGSETFQLLYPGQTHEWNGEQILCTAEIDGKSFFLVKARCTGCDAEHLLIDKDLHGWNGFVCHEPEQAALPRPPLKPWPCKSCGAHEHLATIQIETQGRADFIEESEGKFPEDRWPDGFSWFSMSITCAKCGNMKKDWISLETM
jgi:hypothetical protein